MTRRKTSLRDHDDNHEKHVKHTDHVSKKAIPVQPPQTIMSRLVYKPKALRALYAARLSSATEQEQNKKTKNKSLAKPVAKNLIHALRRRISRPVPGTRLPVYLVAAAAVLCVSTVFWSALGAVVQAYNADQFADVYMFENKNVFTHAVFPGAHTFLLKWPLFVLIAQMPDVQSAAMIVTIAVSLVSVAALAYLLWRIEKRPQVLSLYYLALGLLLLQVPPQAHDGALLPVNLAMLTTRNLEYIVYIAAVAVALKAGAYRSKQFILATLLLGVLFASDRLFVGISLGGALSALVVVTVLRRLSYRRRMTRWLLATVGAAVLSIALLAVIRLLGITHISSSEQSPYAPTSSPKDLVIALWYIVFGTLTQLGANPAFDAVTVASTPERLARRMAQPGAVGWLIAAGMVLLAAYCLVRGIRSFIAMSLGQKPKKNKPAKTSSSVSGGLSVALMTSSFMATALFIATNHYYAADSRYVTIVFFAVVVGTATVVSRRHVSTKTLQKLSLIVLLGLPFAFYNCGQTAASQSRAYDDMAARNNTVQAYLRENNVSTLIGDYWRVIPARAGAEGWLTAYPMTDCTSARQVLTSTAWRPNVKNGPSFAYLVTSEKGLSGNAGCSPEQIIQIYGGPSVIRRVAGTANAPLEQLLIFDGSSRLRKARTQHANNTIIKNITNLPALHCSGQTYLSVVAHQDDDLLFMNPDTQNLIADGNCMRTLYVTAGDSGSSADYGKARLQGAQAAYDAMLGKTHDWRQTSVRLPKGQLALITEPEGEDRISLISLQLPDGELFGRGFKANGFNSISNLIDNKAYSILTIDGSSVYTRADLTDTLARFIKLYRPLQVRTFTTRGEHISDHSDHFTAGRLVDYTLSQLGKSKYPAPEVRRYYGYPVQTREQNVFGEELVQKERAFLAYAQFDGATCNTLETCYNNHTTYGLYLSRQYTENP